METPFTKSGKAHGELDEQCLRRTIYTADGAFPYLKKRLRVVEKTDVELNPIQAAQNVFEKKIQAIQAEVNQAKPNLKTLQLILQGTLLTRTSVSSSPLCASHALTFSVFPLEVNAGASAVIKVFLSDESAGKFESVDRERLADLVDDFVRLLATGLKLNKSFMDPTNDQLILHEEMEKGYERFDQLLSSCSIFNNRRDRGEDSLSLSSSSNAADSIASAHRSHTKKMLSGSGSSDSPSRSGTRKTVTAALTTSEIATANGAATDPSASPRDRAASALKIPAASGGVEKAKSTKLQKDKE